MIPKSNHEAPKLDSTTKQCHTAISDHNQSSNSYNKNPHHSLKCYFKIITKIEGYLQKENVGGGERTHCGCCCHYEPSWAS